MSTVPAFSRTRAYLEFVAAVGFFFLARSVARQVAPFVVRESLTPLIEQALLAAFLIMGYAAFGALFDRQKNSISAQGLPLRPGWKGEAGLGIAVGWGAAIACVLPLTLIGGIAVVVSFQFVAWKWFFFDLLFFAFMALAEEVAFRGYGFQRFASVVGPIGSCIGYAIFYAITQTMLPGVSRISTVVSLIFSLLLSTAYLRTQALWVSWGLNFAWKASRALLFGLAVSGISSHSPIVEGDPMGPFWLTGGGYGLDGSWTALLVLLIGFFVVYRVTRDLDFRYNAPVLVPGGIPVDLDAAARRQHESAMGPEATAPAPLVQIQPLSGPPPTPSEETTSAVVSDQPSNTPS